MALSHSLRSSIFPTRRPLTVNHWPLTVAFTYYVWIARTLPPPSIRFRPHVEGLIVSPKPGNVDHPRPGQCQSFAAALRKGEAYGPAYLHTRDNLISSALGVQGAMRKLVDIKALVYPHSRQSQLWLTIIYTHILTAFQLFLALHQTTTCFPPQDSSMNRRQMQPDKERRLWLRSRSYGYILYMDEHCPDDERSTATHSIETSISAASPLVTPTPSRLKRRLRYLRVDATTASALTVRRLTNSDS